MLIYCAHKYGGDEANKASAEAKIKELQTTYPTDTYISPIHAFGFLYEDIPYDIGLDLCLSLLARCDALLVLSEESEGVRREIAYARLNNIPIFTERTFDNV